MATSARIFRFRACGGGVLSRRTHLLSAPRLHSAGFQAAPMGESVRCSSCGPKVEQIRAALTGGRKLSYKSEPPAKSEIQTFFPDSWVEPETLMDFCEAQENEHPDQMFESEMGLRNQKWRESILSENPTAFDEMGAGQQPRFLWIGCCDSRVAPENMVGAQPGEIFVHRNIANMVIPSDTNLRSALQYAVDYLKVEHIIVCGHYDCGGVKAAMTRRDHNSPLESWLTSIRDVYRLHQAELEAIIDFEERHKRLVELNVIEQCLNLFKTGDVQRNRTDSIDNVIKAGQEITPGAALPRIHGMCFSPSDGILRRLPVDFKDYMRKYKNVYNMYESSDAFGSFGP